MLEGLYVPTKFGIVNCAGAKAGGANTGVSHPACAAADKAAADVVLYLITSLFELGPVEISCGIDDPVYGPLTDGACI